MPSLLVAASATTLVAGAAVWALARARGPARTWLAVTVTALILAIWLARVNAIATMAVLTLVGVTSAWQVVNTRRFHAIARLESEQLRSLAANRAERIAVLFHEVRTPLTLVKGAAELLDDEAPGPLTAKQREFMATITSNCDRTITLAEELLAQARAEAQLFDLRLRAVDLRAVARRAVRDLRALHPNPLVLDSRGAPLQVVGDAGLIRQVIVNCVNNAARHGGPTAAITVRITFADDEALVAISDDGVGMSAQAAAHLFDKFAAGAVTGGTGLGMHIARSIVELHSGRIYAEAVPGRGTTIFFTLNRVP